MSIMGNIIDVNNIKKSFGNINAVSEVSFYVQENEIFGFLGPNGAGKTTTINMLTGLARPDSGQILINGIDVLKRPSSVQNIIGIVPDESNLYPELTGFQNLCFCASLYGMAKRERENKANELLELFQLKKAANRKFAGYSKGMKRKLSIAAGIIHNPKILFLDEPTTGIDIQSARQVRSLIFDLSKKGSLGGTTIFLTTHYIEDAERLCDRISFIKNGQILKTDTVENLTSLHKDKHILNLHITSINNPISSLQSKFPNYDFSSLSPNIIQICSKEILNISPIIRFLEDQSVEVMEAKRIKPSLEQVFIDITGIDIDSLNKEKPQKGGKK